MKTQAQTIGIICLSILAAYGCGAASNPGSGVEIAALDQDFGALTEDATLPDDAEAEAAVEEAEEMEAPEEAPVSADAEPTLPPELEAQAKSLFVLRLGWGNFPINPESTTPVDYSGRVSIDDGVLLGVRGVRFERRKQADSIVRPRADRATVDLTSTITVAADGVTMLVAATSDTASLTIKLGEQYEETFALGGLKARAETNPSATAGQQVRVELRRVPKKKIPECASGTLLGRWVPKATPSDREFAAIAGFVLNDAGARVGRFYGLAGKNAAGEPVAFVKLTNRGALVARGKGSYDPAAKTFSFKLFLGGKEIGAASGNYTEVLTESGYGQVTGSFSAGTSCAQAE